VAHEMPDQLHIS